METTAAAPAKARTPRLTDAAVVLAAVAVVLAAIGLGFGWHWATRPALLKPLVRLDVDLGSGVSLGPSGGTDAILSPDGARLVYVSQGKLFSRKLNQAAAIELADTEGAHAPFFSPDGQWVAFFTPTQLKKISVEGGAAIALCDSTFSYGDTWGSNGRIIFALSTNGGLSQIPASGGTPVPVSETAQGVAEHWPQILPGDRAVLFSSISSGPDLGQARIEVVSLTDGRRRTLLRGGTFGRYVSAANGGYLVYTNGGTMFAVPFDPDKLETHGTPSQVLQDVAWSPNGSAQFDFSRDGTLVYRAGGEMEASLVTVQWLDRAGNTQPLLAKPSLYLRPLISPDGHRLLINDSSNIWVYEFRRDIMTRLTFGGADVAPVWSADGRDIVFSGSTGVWWMHADGGEPRPLIVSRKRLIPWSFTRDGKRLAYVDDLDIWTVPIENGAHGLRAGMPEAFLKTPADERNPSFSPDGRWLAYHSNQSGTLQVYVRAFPDRGQRWQISNAGGVDPVWSGNGRELFFRALDNRLMVVSWTATGDSFVPEKPRVWSSQPLAGLGIVGEYDVASDGKRVLALLPVGTSATRQAQNHVIFLENFADELRRKVPAGK